ncbi:MAG: bifunctional riboflavin kinase/FAD synthetase [Bacteroidota bacterium]
MRIARSLDEVNHDANSVVTVGTFDGVHLAHRAIIRDVVNRARVKEGRSVVVTFDPHPREVVGPSKGPVRLLSTIDERIALIGELNIDLLLILEFTYAFSRISSRDFYRQYIVHGTGVDEVVVGYDHMFGRDREAGIEELVRIGQEFDFSVFAVHPVMSGDEAVSSSGIRDALLAGDVQRAQRLLGRPYVISAKVVRGDGRGKRLGFRTANLVPTARLKVIPARGVYVVSVEHGGGRHFGMMNIGVRPTIADNLQETIEVHLLDFNSNLLGQELKVSFLRRLRDEKKFGSFDELSTQLRADMEEARKTVAHMTI